MSKQAQIITIEPTLEPFPRCPFRGQRLEKIPEKPIICPNCKEVVRKEDFKTQ